MLSFNYPTSYLAYDRSEFAASDNSVQTQLIRIVRQSGSLRYSFRKLVTMHVSNKMRMGFPSCSNSCLINHQSLISEFKMSSTDSLTFGLDSSPGFKRNRSYSMASSSSIFPSNKKLYLVFASLSRDNRWNENEISLLQQVDRKTKGQESGNFKVCNLFYSGLRNCF